LSSLTDGVRVANCRRANGLGIQGDTVKTLSGILLVCCILATISGCSPLPDTYNRIELGKRLDKAGFPDRVVIREDSDDIKAWDIQQFPFGWTQRDLTIKTDSADRVISLKLEEQTWAYWVLVISENRQVKTKTLDSKGHPREQVDPPTSSFMPITNPWFMVGCAGCFGFGMIAFEDDLAKNRTTREAWTSSTTRPAALSE
jgi:hypothetical protein